MARKVYGEFVGYNNNNSDLSNMGDLDISSDWDDKENNTDKHFPNYNNVDSRMSLDNNDSIPNNNSADDKLNPMDRSINDKSTNISYSSFFSDRYLQPPINNNSKFYTGKITDTTTENSVQNDQNHIMDHDNESSISSSTIHSSTRLSHDPFDTVQQRHKSSNRTTMDDPEFLSYLRKGQMRRHNLKDANPDLTRSSLNDLIVKGIGELSGEVYNTFKNKKGKNNNNNNSKKNESNSNISEINNSSEEEEEDTEALETSNEVLRDANNVFDDMISQNKNKMTLITPLVAGLNFENNLGKWVRDTDQTNSQDISANHTAADISSFTTTTTTTHPSNRTTSKINLFKNKHDDDNNNKNDTRLAKETKNNRQFSILEDTPLPFRIKTNFQDLGSGIETLEEHKLELIRRLTPLLIEKDWEKVTELNASRQDLTDVTSLALCLPSLIKCDLSNNNIKIFNSGDCIPENLIELNLSHNLINDTYLYHNNNNNRESWDRKSPISFNNVKILNLSNNQFKTDLSWLNCNGFFNLQELNLSFNEIRSLNGLPSNLMVKRLNLSDNMIQGRIDFEDLVSDVGEYGWQAIEHLDLSNNQITQVYNLDRLKSLKSMNLNGNPLERVIFSSCEGTSRRMSSIELLKVQSDKLKVVGNGKMNDQFIPLPKLKDLEITCYKNFHKMKSLPSGMTRLSIKNGEMDNLIPWDRIPGSLQILEIINIKGFDELPRDPTMEIRLTSLQELNLSYNNLFSWENLIHFLPYSHLKVLRLKGNDRLLYENGQMNRRALEPELKSLLQRAIPCLETIII